MATSISMAVTGAEAAKPIVLVTAVALIDADGRVLLAQRPEGKPMAGLWEFPGGKVHDGETPERALIRELEEELGIDVQTSCLAPFTFASHRYSDFHLLMPLYVCRKWSGIVTARARVARRIGLRRRAASALVSPIPRRSRIRPSGSAKVTVIVSLSATGIANPARCSKAAASLSSIDGETRGLTPPSSASSASNSAVRSSTRVWPPSIAAKKSPSGFKAWRSCTSAPGRSAVQCSA